MNDIFSYLIYAIIIISFLSSFLKKKEPSKQSPLPGKNNNETRDKYVPMNQKTSDKDITLTEKNSGYDILRELEKVFNSDFKVPESPKSKPKDPYDIYERTEIKDKDLDLVVDKRMQREVQDKNPIGSRKTYDETIIERKSISDKQKKIVDQKIESGAKQFERVLAGPLKQRTAIINFNRKLKNPRNVREYILFSEILGKPKALRR